MSAQVPSASPSVAPSGTPIGRGIGGTAPPPGPTETVSRPDPGLARGVWEAPPWAFWTALAVILVAATAYALVRAGILVRPGKRRPAGSPPKAPKA
jgi:hypothetical protein